MTDSVVVGAGSLAAADRADVLCYGHLHMNCQLVCGGFQIFYDCPLHIESFCCIIVVIEYVCFLLSGFRGKFIIQDFLQICSLFFSFFERWFVGATTIYSIEPISLLNPLQSMYRPYVHPLKGIFSLSVLKQ